MISSPCAMLMTPIKPYVIARPSAASNRIVPSEIPLKTRATISPVERRCSTARSDRSASARSSASRSTYSPPFRSSNASNNVFTLPLSLCASARTAASRVALSLLDSCTDACVSARMPLISGSVSFASAAEMAGSVISSAPPCSSLAAARRAARSGNESLSAAIAMPSSRRRRLLMTRSSRLSGTGFTVFPANRSTASSPLIR